MSGDDYEIVSFGSDNEPWLNRVYSCSVRRDGEVAYGKGGTRLGALWSARRAWRRNRRRVDADSRFRSRGVSR